MSASPFVRVLQCGYSAQSYWALQIGSSILADGIHRISQLGHANEAAIIDNFTDVDNRCS
jgi:hypothetical protein